MQLSPGQLLPSTQFMSISNCFAWNTSLWQIAWQKNCFLVVVFLGSGVGTCSLQSFRCVYTVRVSQATWYQSNQPRQNSHWFPFTLVRCMRFPHCPSSYIPFPLWGILRGVVSPQSVFWLLFFVIGLIWTGFNLLLGLKLKWSLIVGSIVIMWVGGELSWIYDDADKLLCFQ